MLRDQPPSSFREFWPLYLREHRKPWTRAMHLVGTGAGLIVAAFAVVLGSLWFLPVALVPGYALAWLSHWLVERNRPATLRHPLWSFRGDFRMLALWLAGRLEAEYERYEIR